MDLTSTILTAAGAVVPANFEGIDLLPILSGNAPERERSLFWRTTAGGHSQMAVRSGDWKLVVDGRATFVFNLRSDPGERNDLAKFRQDVANRLRPMLAAWSADVDAEARERGLARAP
jgi:arylsulfatase A-like enzyme